jgi:hypothetical protein
MTEQQGAAHFCAWIQKRHEACAAGASAADILKSSLPYPQTLEQYRLVLLDLFPPLLKAALFLISQVCVRDYTGAVE